MTGYAEEDILGHRPDVVDPDHDAKEVSARARAIMDQGRAMFETRHRAKDGRILDVEISASFVDIADGRLFIFIRDITARKRLKPSCGPPRPPPRPPTGPSPSSFRP